MSCYASAYTEGGGALKYKETVDKTVNVIQNDYTTLYDLYTADRPCVIKLNAEGGNIVVNLKVGNDSCAELNTRNSTLLNIVANAKHLIATTFFNVNGAASLTFLLDAGEALRFNCSGGAGNPDPNGIFKIHVYEWE